MCCVLLLRLNQSQKYCMKYCYFIIRFLAAGDTVNLSVSENWFNTGISIIFYILTYKIRKYAFFAVYFYSSYTVYAAFRYFIRNHSIDCCRYADNTQLYFGRQSLQLSGHSSLKPAPSSDPGGRHPFSF